MDDVQSLPRYGSVTRLVSSPTRNLARGGLPAVGRTTSADLREIDRPLAASWTSSNCFSCMPPYRCCSRLNKHVAFRPVALSEVETPQLLES